MAPGRGAKNSHHSLPKFSSSLPFFVTLSGMKSYDEASDFSKVCRCILLVCSMPVFLIMAVVLWPLDALGEWWFDE